MRRIPIRMTSIVLVAIFFNFISGIANADTPPLRGLNDAHLTSSPSHSNPPGNATSISAPLLLRNSVQKTETPVLTLQGTIEYAGSNYPTILKGQSQVRAAKKTVTLQKLNEYLPDSLFQFQDLMSSHNKLSQVFYGSPVFPAITGPGFGNDNGLSPIFYSGAGVNLDWAPIDFGLHKARIDLAKMQAKQTEANYAATELDVAVNAASSYLDAVIAVEQIKAAEENVKSFLQFSTVVHAQVDASLKPGADQSLAQAQLANARNDLIRARLARDIAFANLANSIGRGGDTVQIDEGGITTAFEPADIQKAPPVFQDVPILKAANTAILSTVQQRKVLDKEYYPVFHFLGGFSTRGSGLGEGGKNRQSLGGDGVFPVVPNYQVALIVNWNFLDYFRLHQEKKIQDERIKQQRLDTSLVLQNLRTQDVQSRARVQAAMALAENMPIQTESARIAAQQAEARYATGLGSVAQVAEANQVLANSRVQEAVAKVAVWRALLGVSSVHGDLKPFIAEAARVQRNH